MSTVNSHHANARLSRLVEEVEKGEALWVSRTERSKAKLMQPDTPAKTGKRRAGPMKGLFARAEDFEQIDKELDKEIGRLVEREAEA